MGVHLDGEAWYGHSIDVGTGEAYPHKLQVVGAMPPQPEPSSICCTRPGNDSSLEIHE